MTRCCWWGGNKMDGNRQFLAVNRKRVGHHRPRVCTFTEKTSQLGVVEEPSDVPRARADVRPHTILDTHGTKRTGVAGQALLHSSTRSSLKTN